MYTFNRDIRLAKEAAGNSLMEQTAPKGPDNCWTTFKKIKDQSPLHLATLELVDDEETAVDIEAVIKTIFHKKFPPTI